MTTRSSSFIEASWLFSAVISPAAVGHFRRWTAADPHDRARLYMLGDALVKSGKAG